MADELVTIKRSTNTTLPAKVAGQILVQMSAGTTDGTGTMYVDDSTTRRIQIVDDTKLPLTGGTVTGSIYLGEAFLVSQTEIGGYNNGRSFIKATSSSFSVGYGGSGDGLDLVVDSSGISVAKSVTPSENNTTDLGSSSSVFANVYATNFHGTITNATNATNIDDGTFS